MSNEHSSNISRLLDKIKEEIELIGIFVVFLAVLLGHATLVKIESHATLGDIFLAWVVLFAVALSFFVLVFRIAINQTKKVLLKSIDDHLGGTSRLLKMVATHVEQNNLLALTRERRLLMSELDIKELESKVERAVWVVSPDFRYELGEPGYEDYTGVVANNILRGVNYFYFVPCDTGTGTQVRRFESTLRKYLKGADIADGTINLALRNVTVVGLLPMDYPATALFGCALYETSDTSAIFVEYFPHGASGWNMVLLDAATRPQGFENHHELQATIRFKGRLEQLLSLKGQKECSSEYGVRYYQNVGR